MNKPKLLSIMALNGDTGLSLSRYLHINNSTFSAKLNEKNGQEFNKREIVAIKEKYSLNAEETVEIFF